ncbi:PAS domain S-box protein [Thalassolituus marinus]|uniref:histidine kinase n=1 Tax=Thalassolituus marinus TaxID=671053 RepID=A0ABS7ZQD5_9GAMM|nr:PAS domain S-box protein [Thalassolituus marinus]MCA6063834.1 PAS domain S-box protein [Thalassolituus marinus]
MKARLTISKHLSWPLLLLAAGIMLSALVALEVERHNRSYMHRMLQTEAAEITHLISQRIELYQYGLRGMRGAILTAGNRLNRRRVEGYSATRDVDTEFPGARGFGYIRRVNAADEASFIASARADGWPEFTIRQLSPHDGERFVIQYIEPVGRNLQAVGLDIASEKNRREAAWSSLESGEVRLTAPITLVQATGKPLQSFLILMPVYASVTTPDTPEQRIKQGIGWSYAPLITEEILQGLDLSSHHLGIQLADIGGDGISEVFYRQQWLQDDSRITLAIDREVFGRQWQVTYQVTPAFKQGLHLISPLYAFAIGIVISFLLSAAFLLWRQSRLRGYELRAQQAHLAAIVESSSDGIISRDCHGNIVSWNRAAEQMFGVKEEVAIGQPVQHLIIPENCDEEDRNLCAIAGQGKVPPSLETVRQRADGKQVDVAISYALMRNSRNEVVGLSESIRDISQQKEYQQSLIELNANLEKQVEQRAGEAQRLARLLKNVLDSASEVSIIATDKDGKVTLFNRGAERMLGYSAAEFVGVQSPAILHDPAEVELRSQQLEEEFGGDIKGFRVFVHLTELDGTDTREWTYIRKDGQRLQVSLSATTLRDDDGTIVGYLGIAVDVTERKAAKLELEKSLSTTQAILDTAVNPIITIDAMGIIRSFNPAGEHVFGYTVEEVVGQNVSLLMPEPFAGRHDLYMQRFRDMAIPRMIGINRAIQAKRKDGSVFPVQISLGEMSVAGERLVVGILTDISEQRAQTDALGAAMAQLSMAAEVAELGVWSWTPDDNQLQWNDTMFHMYHQPVSLREEGLTYHHWRMRIHPEDRERTEQALSVAMKGEGDYKPVFRIIWPDGEIRYMQGGAQVEMDEDGHVYRVTGINRDITEQLLYEERLRDAKEAADAANAAKSSFLANMSHEIRTPMNAVLGMLKLVSHTSLTERQRDYVNKSQSAAESLLSLLNDILDYSKIEAGKLHMDIHTFSLDEVMRSLAVVLSGNLGSKPIEVLFDIGSDVPDYMRGDSKRLLQILINLAGNAIKFTQQGYVVIYVHCTSLSEDQVQLDIGVRDTGVGISEENQQKIFEGFTQAEVTTSRSFGGTGLGLVISKRLVNLMEGELQLDSTEGSGSHFWFSVAFPLADRHTDRDTYQEDLNVLLVEDHPLAAELMTRDAESLGWSVRHCVSAAEAMAALQQASRDEQPFQLALIDWYLPDLNGIDLAEQIRINGEKNVPPVILISAHGRESLADYLNTDNPPFRDFLSKPVTQRQLAEVAYRAIHEPDQHAKALIAPNLEQRLTGMSILVVEDNETNREIAYELLSGEGAVVDLAEGGMQGVDMVTAMGKQYEVVIMDMQMPDIDGLEATRRIRSDGRFDQLPILAMTANVSLADKEACLQAGMNDHVGKPINLDELVQAIRSLTGKSDTGAGLTATSEAELISGCDDLLESPQSLLSRFAGNLALLKKMTDRFGGDIHEMLNELERHWRQQQWQASGATLHTLKGTSATMGACRLSARCAELEKQFKAGAEEALCEQWTELLQELRQLTDESVSQLSALVASMTDPSANVESTDLSADQWHEKLTELAELLQSNNMSAVEYAEGLPVHSYPGNQAALKEMIDSVSVLNFADAAKILERLGGRHDLD